MPLELQQCWPKSVLACLHGACSPLNKAGGSLHLSTLSISKSVIKVIDHKRAYESQKRDYEPHKRRENGKNVFISVKSSVVGKCAYESQKRAYKVR